MDPPYLMCDVSEVAVIVSIDMSCHLIILYGLCVMLILKKDISFAYCISINSNDEYIHDFIVFAMLV